MAAAEQIVTRSGTDDSMLRKETEFYTDFAKAVDEAFLNSLNAGATTMVAQFITLDRRPSLMIWDDGRGIAQENLGAIVKLFHSPSEHIGNHRGKRGSGAKAFSRHCRALTVWVLYPGESRLLALDYTTQELIDMIHSPQDITWEWIEIPPHCPMVGSGACFIWHDLGKGDSAYVAKATRTAAQLHKQLSASLPRWRASMACVIDSSGRKRPLDTRPLRGEVIKITESVRGVGTIDVNMGVGAKQASKEELMMITFEPLCTVHDFVRRCARLGRLSQLAEALMDGLCDPLVAGEITIKELEPYAIRGVEAGFSEDLYDDEDLLFKILTWMMQHLVPPVTKILGRSAIQEEGDQDQLKNQLVRGFQSIGSTPKGSKNCADITPNELRTSPVKLVLEVGQTVDIQLDDDDENYENTDVRWDTSKAGGSVNTDIGKRVSFTGTAVGKHKLFVHVGKVVHTVMVDIAAFLAPVLSRTSPSGTPGQTISWKVLHTHHINGKLTWALMGDGENGDLVEIVEDTFSARHRLPALGNEPEVWIRGTRHDGTPVVLTGTPGIVPPKVPQPKQTRTVSDSEFTLTDEQGNTHTYEVVTRGYSKVKAEDADPRYVRPVTRDRTRITLNTTHPTLSGSFAVTLRVAFLQLARAIATCELQRSQAGLDAEPLGALAAVRWSEDREEKLLAMLRERSLGI